MDRYHAPKALSHYEKVKTKIEESRRYGLAINLEMFLPQVPATWSNNQSGDGVVEFVALVLFGIVKVDCSTNCVVKIDLTLNHILPGWC